MMWIFALAVACRSSASSRIKSYKDLNDEKYRLTSKLGTTGEMVAKKLIAKAKYHGYDNEQEGVLDVVNGKADVEATRRTTWSLRKSR